MDQPKVSYNTIDEYIATYPAPMQEILQTIRATIHAAVPEATERISYQMPTFYQHGNIVCFAAGRTTSACTPLQAAYPNSAKSYPNTQATKVQCDSPSANRCR